MQLPFGVTQNVELQYVPHDPCVHICAEAEVTVLLLVGHLE